MPSCNKASLILLFFGFTAAVPLPKQFTKCPPNDNACLASAIEAAIKIFASGSKEMGVVPLDPLSIPALTIPAGPSAVNVEQVYHDLKFTGTANTKVTSANYNDKDMTLDFVLTSDTELIMQGDYDMKGKILLLPISGKGPFKLTIVKPTITSKLKLKEVEKEGKKYLEVTDYNLRLDPQRIIFAFENLFDGNKELADALIKTVNDAWDVVYADVRDGYEESYAKIYQSVANQFFSRVPKDEIF